MYEMTERIAGMIDDLFALCEPLGRGDILTHEAIERVVGCDKHTEHYQHCLKLLRRRLRQERRIALGLEYEVGYRLLSKNDQINAPMKRFRRAVRQVREGRKDAACLQGDEELTLHQQVVLGHRLDQCRRMETDLRRQMQDREWMSRPSQVNPRRAP